MSFYGYGRYGVLPTFDMTDAAVGTLSTKIAQVQGISTAMSALSAHPEGAALKAEVDGLEQQISAAVSDLAGASSAYKSAIAGQGDITGGGTRPNQALYQGMNGGNDYQAALKTWRSTPAGQLAMPDPEDYRYPGGGGWLAGDTQRWQNEFQKAVTDKTVILGGLLDQYISTVPVAGKSVSDTLAAAQAVIDSANHAAATKNEADVSSSKGRIADTVLATTVANKKVVDAQVELATTQAKASAAIAKINNPGMSPLMIAALVGIPLAGVIAYSLMKKKGGSVAGYRRKSRRSRR